MGEASQNPCVSARGAELPRCCGATERPLPTSLADVEELLQLLRLTDRDEERTSHTRLAQTRRLALPVECVVPAQGSAEVA